MKFSAINFLGVILLFSLNSCIKDDIVQDRIDPEISISNPLDSLALNSQFTFSTRYVNTVGQIEDVNVIWSSSNDSIISVNTEGLVTGNAIGSATITVESITTPPVQSSIEIPVGLSTVASVTLERTATLGSTSIYPLGGDLVLSEDNGTVTLSIASNYFADTRLPGLYVYLSNSTITISGALEIGRVGVFEGAHSYTLPSGTDINDYNNVLYFCKPFGQRVGHGTLN